MTKKQKNVGDPKWLLFEKCIRGDTSDNVFSAYPGVRKKGSKNKTGLLEAFDDMDRKGYHWNNLMLQRWVDHKEDEHKVLDDYERNRTLIDLSKQPQDIIDKVDMGIIDHVLLSPIKHIQANKVNFHFMKYCSKHDLPRLSQYPEAILKWLVKPYRGVLVSEQD